MFVISIFKCHSRQAWTQCGTNNGIDRRKRDETEFVHICNTTLNWIWQKYTSRSQYPNQSANTSQKKYIKLQVKEHFKFFIQVKVLKVNSALRNFLNIWDFSRHQCDRVIDKKVYYYYFYYSYYY